MFSIFHKKSKFILPPFIELAEYPDRDKYFYRQVEWYYINNHQIAIIDPTRPEPVPMEILHQLVFMDAKGQMTVRQYIEYAAIKDKFGLNEDLDLAIIALIDMLLADGIIGLSDTPKKLVPRYKKPLERQQ
jgi:hypothetical protein